MLKGPYRVISETIVADGRQRHVIYRMLRLKAVVFADGRVEVTGVFGGPMRDESYPFCGNQGHVVTNPPISQNT